MRTTSALLDKLLSPFIEAARIEAAAKAFNDNISNQMIIGLNEAIEFDKNNSTSHLINEGTTC